MSPPPLKPATYGPTIQNPNYKHDNARARDWVANQREVIEVRFYRVLSNPSQGGAQSAGVAAYHAYLTYTDKTGRVFILRGGSDQGYGGAFGRVNVLGGLQSVDGSNYTNPSASGIWTPSGQRPENYGNSPIDWDSARDDFRIRVTASGNLESTWLNMVMTASDINAKNWRYDLVPNFTLPVVGAAAAEALQVANSNSVIYTLLKYAGLSADPNEIIQNDARALLTYFGPPHMRNLAALLGIAPGWGVDILKGQPDFSLGAPGGTGGSTFLRRQFSIGSRPNLPSRLSFRAAPVSAGFLDAYYRQNGNFNGSQTVVDEQLSATRFQRTIGGIGPLTGRRMTSETGTHTIKVNLDRFYRPELRMFPLPCAA